MKFHVLVYHHIIQFCKELSSAPKQNAALFPCCANDQRNEHNYNDFGACPHHRTTDREFECTRCIAADFVKDTIRRVREDLGRTIQ